MKLTSRERSERRKRAKQEIIDYAQTHSSAEVKRHVAARRYPSGRWSRGGANRSSNIKREVRLKRIAVELCISCGGVSQEIYSLTQLFPLCVCGPFRMT